MTTSPWQNRAQRAKELVVERPFSSELLGFYIRLVQFHEDLYQQLRAALLQIPASSLDRELVPAEVGELNPRFESFLSLARAHGPRALAELTAEIRTGGQQFGAELLQSAWSARSASDSKILLAQAFLQPYAELVRSRSSSPAGSHTNSVCPSCRRRAGFAVLRQMGDGGSRSLICSFCLAEWNFRRILCPACLEEDEKKLPVFTAQEFDYIRVECCNSCKTYLKTIDLTKNGHAEPVVDEIAAAPLDLWAREQGYTKIQGNLLGI